MKFLLVVAHPDDEVLGAGATIQKMVKAGHTAELCILCTEAKARALRPEDDQLKEDMEQSGKYIGFTGRYEGNFPNIEMNTVPHLQLVQFIEKAILAAKPDVVITHHPAETNNDHLQTSLACQAAIRVFQRRPDVHPVKELWFMEILSSTEWCVNTAMNRFAPNLFVEIGEEGVRNKLRALAAYRDVMRPYPHPRSQESVTGLAAFRGAQGGCQYAEAFECVFRRITE